MTNNFILPEYLYKLKPFLYIGLGVYVWLELDTMYAVISGTMFVGAGVLALLLRQNPSYEKSRQRMRLREIKKPKEDKEVFKDTLQVTIQ